VDVFLILFKPAQTHQPNPEKYWTRR